MATAAGGVAVVVWYMAAADGAPAFWSTSALVAIGVPAAVARFGASRP